jgi:hypothetical protein
VERNLGLKKERVVLVTVHLVLRFGVTVELHMVLATTEIIKKLSLGL